MLDVSFMNFRQSFEFHAAEFVNRKRLASTADPGLAEENIPRRNHPDPAASNQRQEENDREHE